MIALKKKKNFGTLRSSLFIFLRHSMMDGVVEGAGGGEEANGDAPASRAISRNDVASLVLSYLSSEGFDRAAAAFRR